ncbi:MAG: spermidine/putrescine ABC transporter substrate-binding protein [Kiritimatiellae bacterium]|nr:spermidine/putrescine ABC transporter substrate-binding protein [Kiritimatiellia bacterium]
MRKGILALPVTALLLAGCSKDKETLHVFTWADYVDPDLVARFESENDCQVKIDIFDSNEAMLAKLQAGANGYDVIFPSSYMVAKLARDGMLENLRLKGVLDDPMRLPNIQHIDPAYRNCALDPDMEYGVPYMVTYTGLAWRDDKEPLKSAPPAKSWRVLSDRPDLKGRITILDDMRETLGAALRLNGCSINTTNPVELAKARDTVIEWKKNIAKFENEQYKGGIAGGEFLLVHGYSGDIGQTQLDSDGALAPDLNHVRFFLPEEGFSLSCDEMAVPVSAPNKELAYKFINFLHDPEVAAQNMQYTAYWCPNAAAKRILEREDPEMAANPMIFPSEEDLARGEVIGDLGDALALYTKAWDEVKASENK